MNILSILQTRFADALQGIAPDPAACLSMIRPVQDPKFGDYQANFAMSLGKQLGKPPRAVAEEAVAKLEVSDICEKVEVAGPGFINLTLKSGWLATELSGAADDPRVGVEKVAEPRKIIVDFSSPNVAKPMHVGHLRSTVIGDALNRILRFLGHDVLSDNHIGDWGTQFGMIIYGYKNFLDPAAYEQNPVGELARLYRLVNQLSDYHEAKGAIDNLKRQAAHQESELKSQETKLDPKDKNTAKTLKKLREELAASKEELKSTEGKVAGVEAIASHKALADAHPGIARAARDETAKLHAGDPENNRLWQQFIPQCLTALQGMYDRLDIHFDKSLGESFFNPFLADVVKSLKAKGLAKESDGAQVVFVEGFRAPFIVQKADGAYTYATTDLATVKYRIDEFGANEILYVVDTRQSEHFGMLFATCRNWGLPEIALKHVNFGTVLGKDGRPYKTRSGDTVGLESLLDEAVDEARQVVEANEATKIAIAAEKTPGVPPDDLLDDAEKRRVAEIVGIGGVKYADLRISRDSDYTFDLKTMLRKEGDTATYMQYAYARTRGILRKAGVTSESLRGGVIIGHASERALVLTILRFQEILAGVTNDYRPNVLTGYLFELAQAFSAFYEHCDVAKEPNERLRASRLRLTDLTGRVIRIGLGLLGIETIERM